MPASAHTYPTVAVVLCTRNGERWIEEQLHSLLAQTWPIAVRVFDDASSDNTVELIRASSQGRDVQCHVRNNALGVVDNFFDGLQQVLDEGFTYIALCDQDDVWLPQRIEIGMEKLLAAEQVENAPAAQLVHSDLTMVDAQNALLHPSFIAWRGYEVGISQSLATVLGQTLVMGNTVLMNASLARSAIPHPEGVHVHDYWLALVAETLGERHYIAETLVRYRIHENNVSNSTSNMAHRRQDYFLSNIIRKTLQLDFKLPFKEDNRLAAVEAVLIDPRFAHIKNADREVIRQFARYLALDGSRVSLLVSCLRHRFFRPGFMHKARVIVSLLTTRRYSDKTNT